MTALQVQYTVDFVLLVVVLAAEMLRREDDNDP
jgi:hypothetical protein